MTKTLLTVLFFTTTSLIFVNATPIIAQTNFYLHENGVTILCPDAEIGETGEVNDITYTKRTRDQINNENAPTTCTSGITDMYELFAGSDWDNTNSFNGDISHWDVTSVVDMSKMFNFAMDFTIDLSNWDVSGVTNMSRMFYQAISFTSDLSKWDVANVTNMKEMFHFNLIFNSDLNNWDVSNVHDMSGMFRSARHFTSDLYKWDVSNVTNMSEMFNNAERFNSDVSTWDVSNVTDMEGMFSTAFSFVSDLSSWNVSNVTDMSRMFVSAFLFTSDLSKWDVSNVTNMSRMFLQADAFTSDLSKWDVSNVTDMSRMFYRAQSFSSDLSKWDVSNVTTMSWMFFNANSFSSELNSWDVSNVNNMSYMFYSANVFNSDLSKWDVSNVTNMIFMFNSARLFQAELKKWDVSNVTDMREMFSSANSFTSDLSIWDVSNVTDMSYMFNSANVFNSDLSNWDVSNVTNMRFMFNFALSFQGELNNWDVSNVNDMYGIFWGATVFNSALSKWDVSNVSKMDLMFSSASAFNQDISMWCVEKIQFEPIQFSSYSPLTDENKPVWGTCPPAGSEYTAELPGPHPGWRMIGSPVSGSTYGSMLGNIWTQGFNGTNEVDANSNIFWYDETTRSFIPPTDASNLVGSSSDEDFETAGRGFITYVFEDDHGDGTSTDWPKTISDFGYSHDGEIEVSFSHTEDPEDDYQGWHIAANPYPFPISWSQLVADGGLEDMISIIFVYDANKDEGQGGYRIHFGYDIPSLPETINFDGIIPPFQGFWVRTENPESSGTITFKEEYEAEGGTLLSNQEPANYLAINIENEDVQSTAMLSFNNGNETATSLPKLLTPEKIRFGFLNPENKKPDIFRNLHITDGFEITIPLDFASVHSGEYQLDIQISEEVLQSDMEIILHDNLTGSQHNFANGESYSFSYEATQKHDEVVANQIDILNNLEAKYLDSEERFELDIIFGNTTNISQIDDLPQQVSLDQNYPNPFNPTTQIRYGLTETSDVQLSVYNMLGQRVAVLENGTRNAGWHEVSFDASELSSGIFIYRLQTGNFTKTRKMMLLK